MQRRNGRAQRRSRRSAPQALARTAADRCRRHRLDDLRTARKAPPDARTRQQHPSAQRGARPVRRGPLGRAAEAADSCRRLARDNFVSGGWSTGAVALVAAWAARVHPGAVVATVFPDGPHRYLGSIFDDGFNARHGLVPETAAVRPVEIRHPQAVEATGWTRCRTVTGRREDLRPPRLPVSRAPAGNTLPHTRPYTVRLPYAPEESR